MVDYTLVVGVDQRHLRQLSWTWPTWEKHKPSLLKHPMIVFRDRDEVEESEVRGVVNHPDLTVVDWPPYGVAYEGTGEDKWHSAQRHKMLSGFIYVPTAYVDTNYWLKLDTDVVATGNDDWIDESWFEGWPVIVAHPWSFTKPPDQMLKLDEWARGLPFPEPPLNLTPLPGWSRVKHQRVISWCGFFLMGHTVNCAQLAAMTCGDCKLPVPSQDGFLWYVAKRAGKGIVRPNMKLLGWQHWSNDGNVQKHAAVSLGWRI